MQRREILQTILAGLLLAVPALAGQTLGPRADAIAAKALKESRESKLEDLLEEASALQAEGRTQGVKGATTDMLSQLHKLVYARLMLVRLEKMKENAAQIPGYRRKVEDAERAYRSARAKVKA